MKDGRTHLAYKAEHAVDVVSEAFLATTVMFGDKSDPQSGSVTLRVPEFLEYHFCPLSHNQVVIATGVMKTSAPSLNTGQ